MLNVFYLVFVPYFTICHGIVLNLPEGTIEGITNRTLIGTVFNSFLAVRYAQPPIGILRLQPPEPIQSWEGVYDATIEKNICHQVAQNSDRESEDCLFMNIFTPADLKNSSIEPDLPVMAWIHGGGFISGAGYMSPGGFGPKFFMDANVILVTFNYRLGPFGFLSVGDDVIPGNLGLKDQVMALEWIQKNIRYFGGNSRKVTIFGQSSGGSSVGYHLLSRLSKGLYRAAILQSGSALSPMAFQRNETDYTMRTLHLIKPDYNFTNSKNLLGFLQSIPASVIDNASFVLTRTAETPATYQISKGFFYAPVKEVCHSGAFLTKYQYGAFERGSFNRVPILIGNTNEESLALAKLGDLSFLWKAYDANPSIMVPFDMHIESNDSLKSFVGNKIKSYFGGSSGFANDSAKVIRYHSIHDLDKGNVKQAELMAKHSRVYFYQFSYSGKMGNNPYRVPGTGNVAHSEDLNYIFSRSYSDEIPDNSNLTIFSEADRTVHFRLMSLWTNFAKFLNPTPPETNRDLLQNVTWENVQSTKFTYLDIGENLIMKLGYPKPDGYKFWTDIYSRYAIDPLDTF